MRIFLLRHADADAEVPEGLSDEARTLTSKARHSILGHFESLAGRFQNIHLILTSPLVRAVQTSQILSMALKHEGPLKAHRGLLPDMPVGALESALREHSGQNVALIGHQPSMGATAAHLLGLQSFPRPVSPGTVIGLKAPDSGPGAYQLLFYAAPGQPVFEHLEP